MAQTAVIGLDLDKSRFDAKIREALKTTDIMQSKGFEAVLKAKIDYSDFEDKSKRQRAFTKLKKELDAEWRALMDANFKKKNGRAYDFSNFSNVENEYYRLLTKQKKGTLTDPTEIAMLDQLTKVMKKLAAVATEYNIVMERRNKLNRANDNAVKEAQFRRETRALTAADNAARKLLETTKQLARERVKHARGGGQWVSSIYRQIDLYHQLEDAAKKAGNNKTATYARNQIQALNKQANAVEKVNALFGRQGNILSGLKGLAARYFSIYTVARFGEKVAETTGYFQQQQVALEGILGSASKATSVLNEIKSFALQSPFQTKDLVTFTKQLGAFGVGSNDLFPTVKKLADISAGLGVDMNRIILAYGQVKSAAVLRGQELRQFTEAGIPMVQALADKFTELNGKLVTTGEVFKLISERKVPFEMVASVLSDMTAEGGKFYKMQENITNTLYGQIQKLKDLWTLAMDDMGKNSKGFINGIIKGLQSIVKHIKPIAAALAAAFALNGLGRVVKTVYQLARAFKSAYTAARIFGSSLVSSVSGGIGLVLGAVAGLVIHFRSKSKELQRMMDEVSNSFDRDTAKMVTGLDSLSKKIGSSGVGTKQYNDAVSALVSNYGKFLSNDMVEALQLQGTAAEQAAAKFMELAESIKEAIRQQQEWNKLKAQAEAAGGMAGEKGASSASERSGGLFDAKTDIFSRAVYDGGQSSREVTFAGIEKFLKDNKGISRDDLRNSIASMYGEILEEAAEAGNEFDDSKTALKESIVSRIAATYDIDESTLKQVAERIIETTSQSAIDAFNEAAKKYSLAGATIFAQMMKPFDELDRTLSSGSFMEGKHQIDKDVARYNLAFDALSEAFWTKDEKGERTARFEGYEGSELQNLIDSNEHNAEAAYKVVEGIEKFSKGKATDVVAKLSLLSDRFTQYAEVRSTHSARVTGAFRDNGSLYGWRDDKALKNIVSTYGSPTDKNFWQLRDQLQEDHAKTVNEIARVEALPNVKNFAEYLSELKKQRDAMKTLMGDAYYGTGEKKTGGGAGSEPVEIRDFLTRMREGYDVYKKATQAEGAEMGLAYMQGDDKMRQLFNNLFHAGEAYKNGDKEYDMFKDENGKDLRIGKSGKTLREVVGDDLYIKDGLEKGVIDFEKAFRRIGQALKDYGKADEKHRKGFISLGDLYLRFADQISKDNVAAWIERINKEFNDLGKTFERTSKQVELYQSLMTKGTAGKLGKYSSSNRADALIPESVRNAGNIQQMVDLYNSLLKSQASKAGKDNPALLSIGELNSVSDIQNAIAKVSRLTALNNDNIGLGEYGEAGKKIESLLEKQLGIIIKELQSMSAEVYSGNSLSDAIENAKIVVQKAVETARLQQSTDALRGGDNGAAMKGIIEATSAEAQKILDAFLKNEKFEAWSKLNNNGFGAAKVDITGIKEEFQAIIDAVPNDILKKELQKKLHELELKVLEYNAKAGDINAISDNMFIYRNAENIAAKEWGDTKYKRDKLQFNLDFKSGNYTIEEIRQMREEVAALNKDLEDMGENGSNWADRLKTVSLENIKESANAAQKSITAISDAAGGILDAFSSCVKVVEQFARHISKADVPDGLMDTLEVINDMKEGFMLVIAPALAVISVIVALTVAADALDVSLSTLMVYLAPLIAIAAIVGSIMAIFKQRDRALQHQIEDLEDHIADTENAMKNLEAIAARSSGYRKLGNELKSLAGNYDVYLDRQKQAQLEAEKKDSDSDKIRDYQQGSREALDEFLNSLKDATEEITGSVQDWAGSLSNALRSAFQNGENAARAFRNTAIEMVGDIVNKIIEMTILEPMMEQAINGLLGYSLDENSSNYIGAQDKFKNEDGSVNSQKLADYVTGKLSNDNAAGIIQFMETVQGGYANVIDFINNELAQPLKEAWAYNSDTSELSGGIQGITEDTARTLEGLSYSMLAQLVIINRSVSNLEQSGFAQVQTSWFNDMLNQQRAIRTATEGMNNAISEMRNGIRPMSVKMT